jgi:hypothetical protein
MLGGTPENKSESYLAWDLRTKIKELELTTRRIKLFCILAQCSIQIKKKQTQEQGSNHAAVTSITEHDSLLERMFTGGSLHCLELVQKRASNTSTSTTVEALHHGLQPFE